MVLDSLLQLTLAALFGGMVFFPTVVAPSVFRVLDPATAGTFLRGLFPLYYLYCALLSAVAALALALDAGFAEIAVMVLIAAGFVFARQWLMPRINAARDAGDNRRFERLHGISVGINVAQLIAVLGLIVRVSA